jgi:EAL domain-containing protein (putative c-di-GMP-specific phosphodiesterase class I)
MATRKHTQVAVGRCPTLATWFLEGPLNNSEYARCIPIHTSVFKVGRGTELGLTLANPTVSNVHAEIAQNDRTIVLRDLASTNGTYVNGKRITASVTLRPDDLVHFAEMAFRVRRQTTDLVDATVQEEVCDRALALVQFDKLMTSGAFVLHFQPIVEMATGRTHAYEVFARSQLVGLELPNAMFAAAAELKQEIRLSQMLRQKALEAAQVFSEPPCLFLNTHPAEMGTPGLLDSLRELRGDFPAQPLTLEIHEASITDSALVRELRQALRDLEIGLAYDDFGAGQSRLLELVDTPPDYIKFDLALVRGIHEAPPQRRQMIGTLVRMVGDLGSVPLAEGVESEGEAEACRQIGFSLAQGFYFGQPAPAKHYLGAAEG